MRYLSGVLAARGVCAGLFLLVLTAVFVTAQRASAAPETTPASNGKLRVLVKPAVPFSFKNEKNGETTGFSVELWKKIAEDAGLQYEEPKMVETMPELLNALQKGEADIGVGAISITKDREKVLDFSTPFFHSGLQILAKGQNTGSAFAAFGSLFRGDVFMVIGLFLLAIFIVSNILWLAERHHNEESFPRPYPRGVWEATWWSACTIISGGCENKSAATVPGRLVAIVWMLGGIGLTSYITATLASAMTVNTLTSDIHSLADLKGQQIGTVAGSSAENYLKAQGFNPKGFKDINSAIDQVSSGELKAVVYDSPMLRYYLSTHADSPLQLAGEIFEEQSYGLAMPLGSPHRKLVNAALLNLQSEKYLTSLDKKWFEAKTE